MEYRLNKEDLLKNMTAWNGFLRKKVHLIACGGITEAKMMSNWEHFEKILAREGLYGK